MTRIALGLLWLLRFLPQRAIARVGAAVGGILYWLIPERRNVTRINLAKCFPQTPAAERKEVKVPEKVLQTYVGDYDLGQGRVLQFAFEKGSLWGGPVGDDKSELFATSPTKFFLKNIPIEITFNKDAKGAVTGLTMEREGRPAQDGKKIK